MPHLTRALRHRNYQLFFGGQLISLTGTWMQQIAQSWLVYRLTRSSELLGLVAFAGQIPVLVFAPIGGAVADRGHRHGIVVWTQTLSMLLAFALAALTLTGVVRVWEVFALAALLGVVNAFDMPARQAFIQEMVGRDDLMNAIALNSSLVNGARVVGPAVAGALVAAVGEGWCFFLNGISFIAVIAGLLMMNVTRAERPRSDQSAIAHILEGFTYIHKTAPIRAVLVLLGLVSLTAMPYSVLMPVFADQILGGGPKTLGLLTAASAVGALVGAISLAARKGVRGLGRWIAVSTLAFGASLVLFAWSHSLWTSMAMLVLVGGAMMAQMAASNTVIQAMSPDALRGRVMSVYSMMFMGMGPFGALFAGAVAERIGAPTTVTIGGAACMVAGVLFALRLPALRGPARQLVVAQQIVGGDPSEGASANV